MPDLTKAIKTLSRFLFFYAFFVSFLFFYAKATFFPFPYSLLLALLSSLFLSSLLIVLKKIPLENLENFFSGRWIWKIFSLIITFVIIHLFFLYSNFSPELYFFVFFLLFLFFFSAYYTVFLFALFIGGTVILGYRFYHFQERFLLSYLEKKYTEEMKASIENLLKFRKEKRKYYFQDSHYHVMIEIPAAGEEGKEEDTPFPVLGVIKKQNSELPVLLIFPVPGDYSLSLLELRLLSQLQQLKQNSRIDNYEEIHLPFLEKHLQMKVAQKIYRFYDRFYAATIQFGFYAIPLKNVFLVFLIKEHVTPGFPHSSFLLEILNSLTVTESSISQ